MASQSPKNYLQAISGNFGTITRYTVYLVVTATIVVLLFAVYKVTNIYIYIIYTQTYLQTCTILFYNMSGHVLYQIYKLEPKVRG